MFRKFLLWSAGGVESLITPDRCLWLVNEFFALLRLTVACTPTPLDDAILVAFEKAVDKNALAAKLAARIRGKMCQELAGDTTTASVTTAVAAAPPPS